jgi:hypothetical protein
VVVDVKHRDEESSRGAVTIAIPISRHHVQLEL